MKRWHEETSRTKREWKKHHNDHVKSNIGRRVGYGEHDLKPGADPAEIDCVCDNQVGRFRKTHGVGCGKSRCGMCKRHKYPKRKKSIEEIQSDLNLKEQRREIE